jgi:hypothetical protein
MSLLTETVFGCNQQRYLLISIGFDSVQFLIEILEVALVRKDLLRVSISLFALSIPELVSIQSV